MPERDGGVALRIQVHEQRGIARVGDARAEVHGRGRLPDSALLVGDRHDVAHAAARLGPAPVGSGFPGDGSCTNRQPRGEVRGRSVRAAACGPSPAAAGNPAGVGATFRITCRWRCRAPSNGHHRAHGVDPHPERGRRRGAGGLLVGVARALPGDQDAALAQQRRRVLLEERERAEGASGDHVVAPGAASRRGGQRSPLLDPRPSRNGRSRSPPRGSADRSRRTCGRPTPRGRPGPRGSAAASTSPGKPAPAPRSATRAAAASSSTSRPESPSATCARSASPGVRSVVGGSGSAARALSNAYRRRSAASGRP